MRATIPRPRSVALPLAAASREGCCRSHPARAPRHPPATCTFERVSHWRARRSSAFCVYVSASVAANSPAVVATARYLAMLVAIDQIASARSQEKAVAKDAVFAGAVDEREERDDEGKRAELTAVDRGCRAPDACAQASELPPHAVLGTKGEAAGDRFPRACRLVAGCDRRARHACEYLLLVVDRAGAAVGIDTGPA
jgi:hypothetical protein